MLDNLFTIADKLDSGNLTLPCNSYKELYIHLYLVGQYLQLSIPYSLTFVSAYIDITGANLQQQYKFWLMFYWSPALKHVGV